MSSIKHKIQTMMHTPRIFMIKFANSPIFKIIPDRYALKIKYKNIFHRELNLVNPKTFNEKLQWLKLFDRKPIYSTMVDKYAAKQYVAEIIGKEHIIPTLGVWDNVDDIDINSLPNQFVLKCTHGSGDVLICKDISTFDIEVARKRLAKALNTDYYSIDREWPYKNVPRRIIAEPYMIDKESSELRDYKFFCFNGQAKCFKIDFDRFVNHRANYFELNGSLMNIGEVACPPNPQESISIPHNINQMIEYANRLSQSTYFLRTDFYYVDGTVYFGELTLYPAGGFGLFLDDASDLQMGEWLRLPTEEGV